MSKPTPNSQNTSNVFNNYNDMCRVKYVFSHVILLNNLTLVLSLAKNVDVSFQGDFLLLNSLKSSTCLYNYKYQM